MFAFIPLINPAFVWAAIAVAAIPIVIYILNRRRYRKVYWAAMHFLLSAHKKSVRRTRLEQLLLLAVRTLLIALLALAMARPYWPSKTAPAWLHGGTHHVLVIDNSLSMRAHAHPDGGEDSPTAFDQLLLRAQHLLSEIPTRDPVSFITMDAGAKLLNRQPTFDKEVARRLLLSIHSGYAQNNLAGALRHVQQLADQEQASERELAVYMFSDFTVSALGQTAGQAAQPSESISDLFGKLSQHARFVLHDVGRANLPNLSVTALAPAQRLVGTHRPTEIVTTVTNTSAVRSAPASLRLFVNQQLIRDQNVPELEPQESHTVRTAFEFQASGFQAMEALITPQVPDALPADNSRRCVVDVKRHFDVLIVDGKPGLTPLEGQAGYLATALAPRTATEQKTFIVPTLVTENELSSRDLRPYGTVVLCNVKRLPADVWERIHRHVQQGNGLLIFLGDHVDIGHYNEAADALLPANLRDYAYEVQSDEQFTHFDMQTLGQALSADFAGRSNSGLFRARIHQYIAADETELDKPKRLLSYENGDGAILAQRVGRGTSILVTTTANMDWTNLPAKGDYVALVRNLIQLASPPNAPTRNLIVHQSFEEISHDASAIALSSTRIIRREGGEWIPEVFVDDDGTHVVVEHLEEPGWYSVQTPLEDGPLAVDTDPAESNLIKLSEMQLQQALGGEFNYVALDEKQLELVAMPTVEYASLMVYAVLLLLLAESVLALWFGHQRG